MRDASVPAESEPAYDNNLESAAAVVAAWCGESLLHAGEDPARALAPGTARRGALDAALREIDMDLARPSADFRRRFALMLGLERILSEPTPSLASGLTLRAHQVDALAGMLAALIGDFERGEEERRRTTSPTTTRTTDDRDAEADELEDEAEDEDDDADAGSDPEGAADPDDSPPTPPSTPRPQPPDPGARRRYRFKHPTASGKTVAAAGFVDACRTAGVLILTHRRLLVDQFQRDLQRAGLRPAPVGRDRPGPAHPRAAAGDGRDVRLVHQAPPGPRPRRVRRRALRRGSHRARRAHEREHPQLLEADVHRHDGDRPAAAEARPRRLPRRDRRLPARRRRAPRRRRAASLPAGAARRIAAQRARGRRRLRPGPARRRARPRGAQHGGGRATTPIASATARASSTRPASTTPRTSRRRCAPPGSRPSRSRAERPRACSPRRSRPTSAARRTCSSTPSCWPRAGTRRARRSACTSRRPRAAASTSSASAASCGCTGARRPASSSTSPIRPRRTPIAR